MNTSISTVTIGVRADIARMGFGTMRLTGPKAWGPPADQATALAVLKRAVELGVELVDTAGYYGPEVTNALIREALSPYPPQLFISTKVGVARGEDQSWQPHARPEQIRADVEANLLQLGVEQLHLVHLRLGDGRMLPFSGVPLLESLGALIDLKAQGKIGHIGLSSVTVEQIKEAQSMTPIAAIQNMYNVGNVASQQVLDLCESERIAFLPYFPLAMGALARPGSPLAAIAARYNASPAQVALAWLLAVSSQTILIPGTSSIAHLEENYAARTLRLKPEEIAAIREAAQQDAPGDAPKAARP